MTIGLGLPPPCAATNTNCTSFFLEGENPTFSRTLRVSSFTTWCRSEGAVREGEYPNVWKRYAKRTEDEPKQRENWVERYGEDVQDEAKRPNHNG